MGGYNPQIDPYGGVDNILPVLSKRFKIGILGQYGPELRELLEENDLIKYFSYRYTQEQFSITKPDPRYFEQILDRSNVKANESIMVGDRIDKDIIPAKKVGMKTVRIKVGLHKNQIARVFAEIPDCEYECTISSNTPNLAPIICLKWSGRGSLKSNIHDKYNLSDKFMKNRVKNGWEIYHVDIIKLEHYCIVIF